MLKYSLIILLISLSSFGYGQSQDIEVKGYFDTEQAMLGEKIPYTLTAKYPRTWQVLFPDSLYDFSPFELLEKRSFPTRSDEKYSRDSAIYYLATYELDSIQSLSLPVFQLVKADSIYHFAGDDQISLVTQISVLPDSLNLKESAYYQNVKKEFNYPYFITGLIALLVIVITLLLIFGKGLKTRYKIWRLQKAYKNFEKQMQEAPIWIEQSPESGTLRLLQTWKMLMKRVNDQDYEQKTTKEILQIHDNQTLARCLQTYDRCIYGGITDPTPLLESLDFLADFSQDLYLHKIKALRDGGRKSV